MRGKTFKHLTSFVRFPNTFPGNYRGGGEPDRGQLGTTEGGSTIGDNLANHLKVGGKGR